MPDLNIYNHQGVIELPATLRNRLQRSGRKALAEVIELCQGDSTLQELDEVEVNLVDDDTIAGLHLQFMAIPGPTDVITFDHGEIYLSVETAESQAREYANDFEKEIMLYIIHGLLHLAGYDDATQRQSDRMEELQSAILARVW
jgi:probable rRNA maturation factor